MFHYGTLRLPIVGAPMAGGPSTPELVAAVGRAGGIGFLAAAYLTPDRLEADIAAVRASGVEMFGVNVFVPEFGRVADIDEIRRFRDVLQPYAQELGVELPSDAVVTANEDDHWAAKLDIVERAGVPVVSFTFGFPNADDMARLHARDIAVTVTVTSADDAVRAVAAGADSLCVQGPAAGGHRSTFLIDDAVPDAPLGELLAAVRAAVDVPVVAAGGIATAEDVRAVVDQGAVAAQIGTALLRAPEAGTKPAHADALVDDRFARTVVTRAFSGRPARGLRNAFIDRFDSDASNQYPAVNTLTGGIRKAAAADPDGINLWAGTGHRRATAEPAAIIVRQMASALQGADRSAPNTS